jgi:hypothetical protein
MGRKVYDKAGNVVKDRGEDESAEEDELDEDAGDEDGDDEDEDGDDEAGDEDADDDEAGDDEDADDEDADDEDANDEDADDGDDEAGDEDDEDADDDDEDVEDHPSPKASAKPTHDAHDEDEDEDDDDDDEVAAEEDTEDPSWWIPHAVLGALVLIGVLGFFGVFNESLSFLRAPMAPASAAPAQPSAAAAAPAPPPPAPAPPDPRQQIQANDADLFGAQHILVMHAESRRKPPTITRTKDEAKTRAEEALKKARQAGADFDQLVVDYSDEPGADRRKGNLGNFRKGTMVPEFQEGLEKTKVGEISDLVETPFGFHIIKRTK